MSAERIAVFGGGGFAREVAWLGEACGREIVCFIDDDAGKVGSTLNDVPILSLDECAERFPGIAVAAGIGSPGTRQSVMDRVLARGLQWCSLIHPRVERSRWITIGSGVVVCAGNILTTNITVGDQVQINLDCTIGHDVRLDDYATLAPGVHVSGAVHIGRHAYLGTGAAVINGTQHQPLIIGAGAVVGAGACVTRSVDPGVTVVGVPARPLGQR
ncbi:MAG TPA: NeuD/PglB/VioB family sugar acetyltransferase [Vicinamibacterales bacterium]|nr:NeuD/PglB/VioB family sugar acetyltransferase [Vicinamibacterales bacterium]